MKVNDFILLYFFVTLKFFVIFYQNFDLAYKIFVLFFIIVFKPLHFFVFSLHSRLFQNIGFRCWRTSTLIFNPQNGCIFQPIKHLNRDSLSYIRSVNIHYFHCKWVNSFTKCVKHFLSGACFHHLNPLITKDHLYKASKLLWNFIPLHNAEHTFINISGNSHEWGFSHIITKELLEFITSKFFEVFFLNFKVVCVDFVQEFFLISCEIFL